MTRSRPVGSRRGAPAKSDPARSRTGNLITYRPNMMRAREGAAHALDDARANVLDLLDDVVASPVHYPAWEPSLAACRSSAESLRREVMRTRDGVARVVVIGRTKAGKSTLRYVLTGANKGGIGRGGQRTTRRAISYRWRGYEIVDTPGVGGIGTEADTQIALDAAADADLVLWVTTSDGVQLATEAPVLRAAEGRPLLVLVNHKSTFALEEIAAGLDVGVILTDRTGLEDRIRSRLAGFGVEDPQIEHVHLGLARCARYELNDSEVAGLSGVVAVEESLAAAVACAVRNRPTTSARRLQVEVAALADALRTAASLIDSHRRHLQSERKELLLAVRSSRESYLKATGSFADALQEEAREELATALEAARIRPHRGEAESILTECVTEVAAGLRQKLGDAVAAGHTQALRELPAAHRPAEEPDSALDTLLAVELLPLQGDP
jgi:GTPase